MHVGDDESEGGCLEEDADVTDRLSHALDVEEVAVVGSFQDAAGVGAASHVAGDPYVVGGAVGGVCLVVALALEPGRDTGVEAGVRVPL